MMGCDDVQVTNRLRNEEEEEEEIVPTPPEWQLIHSQASLLPWRLVYHCKPTLSSLCWFGFFDLQIKREASSFCQNGRTGETEIYIYISTSDLQEAPQGSAHRSQHVVLSCEELQHL